MNTRQRKAKLSIHGHIRRSTRVAATLGLCSSCITYAAIGAGATESGAQLDYSGNGELALFVFDDAAKISYTLDLGVTMDRFRIDHQQDYGSQRFWAVDDAQWLSYLPQINTSNMRWTVMAFDTVGGFAVDGIRLFTTVRQGQEALVSNLTNTRLSESVAGNKSKLYFDAVNRTGTHPLSGGANSYQYNGSSVNAEAEGKAAYFGGSALTRNISPSTSGAAPFDISNRVGESSWFYQLSRSAGTGSSSLLTVTVDEFDNLRHDGYWGFTYVDPSIDSPYKGKYLLSYTLEAALPTASTAAGQLRMSFTDYSAGFASKLRIETPLGEFADYRPGSLVIQSPVPEPATWGLLGLGLMVIGLKARQKHVRA